MTAPFTIEQVGQVVATLSPPPSTPADLALYAKASGDTNPLHLDPEFARKAGFDRLVVHGMLGMAHMARLLTNTFAAESITSFNARFSAVILVGEQVHYTATLTELDRDYYKLSLESANAAGVVSIRGDAIIDARRAHRPTLMAD